MVTHPGTYNRVWRSATTLIEANALNRQPKQQNKRNKLVNTRNSVESVHHLALVISVTLLKNLSHLLFWRNVPWTKYIDVQKFCEDRGSFYDSIGLLDDKWESSVKWPQGVSSLLYCESAKKLGVFCLAVLATGRGCYSSQCLLVVILENGQLHSSWYFQNRLETVVGSCRENVGGPNWTKIKIDRP